MLLMKLIRTIDFDIMGDDRGSLIALEQNKNIPFDIKRIYYIFNTDKDVSRGFHAHKNLQQIAICVKGQCRFTLDNGRNKEDIVLSEPNVGLYIGNNIWREMHDFSKDCVLVVIASELYSENDYIRNYDEFLAQVNKNDSSTQ